MNQHHDRSGSVMVFASARWMRTACLGMVALLGSLLAAQPVNGNDAIDFNRDIRPLLSDRCFNCHGPDASNREADLRLDERTSVVDAVGAIVPGDPDASSFVERIATDDADLKMPPPDSGKELSSAEIELLRRWVESGANYATHWAFVPPVRPETPEVSQSAWIRNPIDSFVMARLDRAGLQPSPEADRVTLIRRLYLDLLGLIPSPQEVAQFVNDPAEDAYEQLVERLLESPHFGERWARWWLDAARYSDSDGYEKDKQRSVWFYRDWVIQAMNDDKPYDAFIVEQIAGDLLPGAGQSERVATGFLRNSMVNEEGGADPEQFRVEGMFDRVDAIGKAILGVTTQCAQCHSHKYDPLTQEEYYQMFASLNDVHEAMMTVYTPSEQQARNSLLEQIAALENGLKLQHPDWRERIEAWEADVRGRRATWTVLVPTDLPFDGQKFRLLEDGSIVGESYAPTQTSPEFRLQVNAGRVTAVQLELLTHPQLPRSGPGRSIYGTAALTEFEVDVRPSAADAATTKIEWQSAYADVNPTRTDLPAAFRQRDAASDDRVTGPIEYAIDRDGKTAWSTDIDPGRRNQDLRAVFVPKQPFDAVDDATLTFRLAQNHGGWNSDDNQNYLLGRYRFSVTTDDLSNVVHLPLRVERLLEIPSDERTDSQWHDLFRYWITTLPEFASVNERIEQLWQQHPAGDSQLVVESRGEPRPSFILDRGDFLRPTLPVAPAAPLFLGVMINTNAPDRLDFARWLVRDDSPTTARAIVNRMWQAYFGNGFVLSPEDLGSQSAPPSHPQLLDWLSVELMQQQWRLKHLHRLIVTSATYRQRSEVSESLAAIDPFNRLLARGPRFRVEAEMVRDVVLTASGLLNRQVGGPSIYPPAPRLLFEPPASYGPKNWPVSTDEQQYRRSMYVHSYRSVPYPVVQVFDAPKGDAACIRRTRSNTPLQALVVLNEPQFVESARALAGRVLRECDGDDVARIDYAHQICVARHPDEAEAAVILELLNQQRERLSAGELHASELLGADAKLTRQLSGNDADELAAWMIVSRVLLNLDETITKQ